MVAVSAFQDADNDCPLVPIDIAVSLHLCLVLFDGDDDGGDQMIDVTLLCYYSLFSKRLTTPPFSSQINHTQMFTSLSSTFPSLHFSQTSLITSCNFVVVGFSLSLSFLLLQLPLKKCLLHVLEASLLLVNRFTNLNQQQ